MKCRKCGEEFPADAQFCPACGAEVANHWKSPVKNKKMSSTAIIVVIILAALALALAIFFTVPRETTLQRAYDSLKLSEYSHISDDGSCLMVDTNPEDITDEYAQEGADDVLSINEYLGLPDSLESKMGNTCGLDGTQTATYDDVEISWSYNPDDGFEVVYSMK